MERTNSTPKDLAKLVAQKLKTVKVNINPPNESLLIVLFETLFFTSLKTEEGQLIKVTVTFIDTENPDPTPPKRVLADRWGCIHFDEPIPFTVKNLVKLSKAADPWSSSLAVFYNDEKELLIWGMIDQAIHYQSFLNYETEDEPEQPGIFQATITDIGNISAIIDYELIANLKQNILTSNYIDVFRRGPVSKILENNAKSYKKAVASYIKAAAVDEKFEEWEPYLKNLINQSLSRILLRIQNYHHGGAFIITTGRTTGLTIKHKLSYDRLFNSITGLANQTILNYDVSNDIFNDFIEGDDFASNHIPVPLYLEEDFSRIQKEESNNELKGAIRFIASLSCIDGLVVLSPELKVKGFGAVIKTRPLPETVHISHTSVINENKLSQVSPDHFGTRHRSMFSYCWSNTGSLGFVVSQDGEIRVITRISNKLIMWENIKVQQFIRSAKLIKPSRPFLDLPTN